MNGLALGRFTLYACIRQLEKIEKIFSSRVLSEQAGDAEEFTGLAIAGAFSALLRGSGRGRVFAAALCEKWQD
ncbi:hypothetical protein FRC00_009847, partial [Tulasnella sp. 408]